MRLYVNGVDKGTISVGTNYVINDLVNALGGTNTIDGVLDEVGIWSRDLSDSEVSELYNSGDGLQYPFGEDDFELTASNLFNGSSIDTFNATITNSTDTITLNTTNGTIFWEYNQDELLNITTKSPNYFDRTYENVNISDNLEAELHNLVVTAKNNVTDESIDSFSLIYNSTTFSTTNGTIKTNLGVPETEGGTFNFTVSAEDYVAKNFTHETTTPLEAVLYPANTLTFNIFDAETLNPITEDFPYVLEGTKDFYEEGNITNGSLVIQELQPDNYEITLDNDAYYKQKFFIRLEEGEAMSLDSYLYDINTTLYSTAIEIIDPSSVPLEAALVSIQQRIEGNYRTISQKYTDSTGVVAYFLYPDADHRAIIEKEGYSTKEYEIRPISDPYSVTLRMDPETTYNYEIAYDNVSYKYEPDSKLLNRSQHNFSLSLSSPEGDLQYFGVSTIHGNTNITGSPSGGTAVHTADLGSHTNSSLDVTYFFKSSGRQEFSFTITYPVYDINVSDTSLISIKDDSILQDVSPLVKFFIIIGLTIFLIFIGVEIGLPIEVAGFILTGVLTFSWLIGWVNLLIPIVVGLLTIGSFFLGDGNR